MLLQLRAIGLQIDRSQIIHKEDGMGIADVHADRIAQGTGTNFEMQGIDCMGQGYILPGGSQAAHFHGYQFIPGPATAEPAAQGVYHHRITFTFLQKEPSHTTGGVAASLNLATVRIEDSYKSNCIRGFRSVGRLFDNKQFVPANPLAPVTYPHDLFNCGPVWLVAAVHNNKIIAKSMHL